jgi:hypothetical protein
VVTTKRGWARARASLAWGVVTCVVVLASGALHASTDVGRAAVRDLTERVVNDRIDGRMHIGAITSLAWGRVEMRDVRIVSPDGELVLSGDRVSVALALRSSLERRALVLGACEIVGGETRLARGRHDQLGLVEALEIRGGRPTIPVELPGIRMRRQTVRLDLPGLPSVVLREVTGIVDATIARHFVARMRGLEGRASVPIVDVAFDRLSGRIAGGSARPLVARMVLDLEVADPGMAITYRAPAAIGRAGNASATLELGARVADDSRMPRHAALERDPRSRR